MSLTARHNFRLLWLQFRGMQMGVLESLKGRGGYYNLKARTVAHVLLNRRVPQKLDALTAERIKYAAWKEENRLGEGPEAEVFRTYLKYLDWRLWERTAQQSGIKLSIIQHTLQGITNNPQVLEALHRVVLADEEERLVASNGEAQKKMVAATKRYRGVVSNVAREIGVTPQAVSQVASGKRTSARIARALAKKTLHIEREIFSRRFQP